MTAGFTRGNTYLFSRDIWTWNLPSGYTCPGARECLAFADRATGKITVGKHSKFKCYSAVTERFPAVRDKSWTNYELVRNVDSNTVAERLLAIMPRKAELFRIHAAGDLFSQAYFDGWLQVCRREPSRRFWLFTKSIPFVVARLGEIPANLNITASRGGKHDTMIDQYGLKSARVVYSVAEAESLGLQIDVDDRIAAFGHESFALLENFSKGRKQLPVLDI